MSSKMNQRITYLMNIGLLISSLTAYGVAASTECGQAKLVQAGSTGVNVMNNTCAESSRILSAQPWSYPQAAECG
jgi:hypothetical protein